MPLLQPHLCVRAGSSILRAPPKGSRDGTCLQLPTARIKNALALPPRPQKRSKSVNIHSKQVFGEEGGPLSTAGLERYCHETQQAAHLSRHHLMVGQAQLWPTRPPKSIFGKRVSFSSTSINEHSEIFSLLLNRTAEEKENKITLEVTGAERVLLQLL